MSKNRGRILGTILIAFLVNVSRDRVLKSGTLPAFLPSSLSGSLEYLTSKKTIVQHITDYTQITDLENDITRNIQKHRPTLVQITPIDSKIAYNGTIVTSDGYVLTTRLPEAASYTIVTAEGSSFSVTWRWHHPLLPLTLLHLPAPGKDDELLDHAQVTDNTKSPDLGSFVHAILPTPQPHLLFGIVDTFSPAGTGSTLLPRIHVSFLESDIPALGTPLFSHRWDLVGILGEMEENQASVLPFSSALLQQMISSIAASGAISVAQWGATFTPVTTQQVKLLKLPKTQGMLVASLTPESPLLKAGLQKNDLILEIDGETIEQAQTSIWRQFRFKPGQQVPITIFHAGKYKTVEVTF